MSSPKWNSIYKWKVVYQQFADNDNYSHDVYIVMRGSHIEGLYESKASAYNRVNYQNAKDENVQLEMDI